MEYGIKDVTVPPRLKFSSSLFPAKTSWIIIECEVKALNARLSIGSILSIPLNY